jgi:hypothetical protein
MKKILYISFSLFLFASCEKQVIRPISSSDNSFYSSSGVVTTNGDEVYETNNDAYLDQKSINGDLIIDPNGRDDVGSKKDKKSK